ncbi:hypothetical protein QFZ20_005332 [Flavobacterium sp. W4I14]|nr:hypothetical protein [Flavobacterium sp. W4I14]
MFFFHKFVVNQIKLSNYDFKIDPQRVDNLDMKASLLASRYY